MQRLFLLLLVFHFKVYAGFTADITLSNDYLFNGVTQTQKDPALQMGVNYQINQSWYLGAWTSNVDFGTGTDLELDFYTGYAWSLQDGVALDIGVAEYTYHGDGSASDINYTEFYFSASQSGYTAKVFYAPDYAGTGAGHVIVDLSRSWQVHSGWGLNAGVAYSKSLDSEDFTWSEGDSDYLYGFVTASKQLFGFDLSFGLHALNEDSLEGSTFLLAVSRSLEF